jgi:predicted glycosyltransferase
MRYLFLTNTPAHVHLYKHAVERLRQAGHDVLVLGRDYGCTVALLEYYDLPYEVYGSCDTTKLSLFRQLPRHYRNIVAATRRFDPDLVFGMGSYAAHAGAVSRTPVVLILDSEPTSLDHLLSRPFANTILTPHAFEKDLGAKHYRFRGFKETAYLHPDEFEPADDIRAEMGVGDEPFAVVRFNAFGSHHDVSRGGFTPDQRRELLRRLSDHATVFVSDEGGDLDLDGLDARPFDLHPALLHDALSEAALLVADTQTMVTEAALLGTPAIRSNSWVGEDDMGNFRELERNDLVFNLADFEDVRSKAIALLRDRDTKARWSRRRDAFLEDKVNLTDLIVDIASNRGTVRTDERVVHLTLST